jgi:hypothetical protein
MEGHQSHETVGPENRTEREPLPAAIERPLVSAERDLERVQQALDRLGEAVEAVLVQSGMTEDELVEFLDPSRPMPDLSDRPRQ